MTSEDKMQKRIGDATSRLYLKMIDLWADIQAIKKRMDWLESLGMTRASIWMREGEYMYLIHPTDDQGKRKREYIGNDPDRTDDARARVRRQREWDELHAEWEEKMRRLRSALHSVDLQIYSLKAEQTKLFGEGA